MNKNLATTVSSSRKTNPNTDISDFAESFIYTKSRLFIANPDKNGYFVAKSTNESIWIRKSKSKSTFRVSPSCGWADFSAASSFCWILALLMELSSGLVNTLARFSCEFGVPAADARRFGGIFSRFSRFVWELSHLQFLSEGEEMMKMGQLLVLDSNQMTSTVSNWSIHLHWRNWTNKPKKSSES